MSCANLGLHLGSCATLFLYIAINQIENTLLTMNEMDFSNAPKSRGIKCVSIGIRCLETSYYLKICYLSYSCILVTPV